MNENLRNFVRVGLKERLLNKEQDEKLITKKSLLGKKFYHGTVLETVDKFGTYLYITDDFEDAKRFSTEKAESLLEENAKEYTAIVFEIIINNDIINYNWIEDDGQGGGTTGWGLYKSWQESLKNVGAFIITNHKAENNNFINLNEFKIVYKKLIK